MDIVSILRELWRMRLAVICAFLIALLVGLMVPYRPSFPDGLKSRQYAVGVATVRLLVDTPASQVIEVAPKGSETLGVRANLLANLIVDGVVKNAIARRAGVPPAAVVAVTASAAAKAPGHAGSPRGYSLTTSVPTNTDGEQLPIIQIDTQAPDVAGAAKLADAAVAGLRSYLDSEAALQQVPDARRLRVSGLGVAQAQQAVRGPRALVGFALAGFLFVGACAAMLVVSALIRGWRAASEEELVAQVVDPHQVPRVHLADDYIDPADVTPLSRAKR
jgi:hypothetical protein